MTPILLGKIGGKSDLATWLREFDVCCDPVKKRMKSRNYLLFFSVEPQATSTPLTTMKDNRITMSETGEYFIG